MKRKALWKKLLKAAVVILVIGGMVGGYLFISSRPKQYQVTHLHTDAIEEQVSVTGTVKSNDTKTYYADFTAPITMLDVKKGETVKAGMQVVTFDTKDLEFAAKQSSLTVQGIAKQYDATVEENQKNTMTYQTAQMSQEALELMIAEKIQTVKELQAKVTKAADKQNDISLLSNKVNIEVDEDDKEDLQETLDMWKVEYQKYNVPRITSELAAEQEALHGLMTYRSEYTAEKQTADRSLINESEKAEIAVNKQAASLTHADAKETLEEAEQGIVAEYAGIVSEVFVEEGATVNKGTPLFSVENSAAMIVEVMVSKYDIAKIKEGQQAQIMLAGNTYEGNVTKIKRVAETDNAQKAKVPVEVTIHNADENIYIGLEADVDIIVKQKEEAVLLPITAVYTDDAGDYCYLIRDGVVARQDFEAGLKSEQCVEAVQGIEQKDEIITDALTETQIGQKAEAAESVKK